MAKPTVSYADLVAAIGEAKTLALSKDRGGRGLYIPSLARLGPSSPVVQLLGVEAAEALARLWPGETIDIPLTQGKRARVWELREGGRSISAIAKEMRCHERTVYNILAAPRPAALGARVEEEPPPLLAYIAKR
ncbi:MAG TPA: helix-turn-helix domain-containing protein [Candidatus Omnitrophota bacterium]|nr:helix-turn-helix domain-containing protein [Candidatus Omnitrophota bacterium]